ncbi:MAG: Hsp20/alpha crystallin family protein [Clostridia bacterium]|nr:Hsp20/alpha crystallin family protein [Clostridia bacterium]
MLPSIFGENLFDDLWNTSFDRDWFNADRELYGKHAKNLMKTDVHETQSGYEMDIELPGFQKEDIKVDLKEGYLTVSAQKSLNKEEHQGKKVLRQERYSGSCSRTFYIGDVKAEDVKGKYEAGVLTLSFPKEDTKKLEEKRTIAID